MEQYSDNGETQRDISSERKLKRLSSPLATPRMDLPLLLKEAFHTGEPMNLHPSPKNKPTYSVQKEGKIKVEMSHTKYRVVKQCA